MLLALAAAASLSAAAYLRPVNDEASSANWAHVQSATQSGRALQWIAANGSVSAADAVLVAEDDEDRQATRAIQEALQRGDTAAADALFAGAQTIAGPPTAMTPSAQQSDLSAVPSDQAPTRQPPAATLTPGLRTEIARGDAKLYHVHLSDSCFNDGDVVEILLNGQPMFIVPITNAGATLSVPVSATGATVIAIRGLYDGGGGITVACRTSRGEGFVRVMETGEIQPLGVVLP